MPHEIVIPRLGWSMEEGTFVRWLKAHGEAVRAGEPLFELEGDKAIQEIEAIDSGTLRIAANAPSPGGTVQVGTLIGHLVAEGEAADAEIADGHAAMVSVAASGPAAGTASTAPRGQISEPSATETAGKPARHRASPRARRAAAEHGVELGPISGTGRNGRIRERDVLAVVGK